jgi:hypothetical protein
LRAQEFFYGAFFFRGHPRSGFIEHDEEPIDLVRLVGVPDVAAFPAVLRGGDRGYDRRAVRGEESEEWNAIGPAEPLQEVFSPRVVEGRLIAVLLSGDIDYDEILVDSRLEPGGLDETIEFLAPASPRGAEDEKDGAVVGGGRGFGLVEQRGDRGRSVRRG